MNWNFEFDVNKKCSTAIWVTLYFTVRAHKTAYDSENEVSAIMQGWCWN